MKGISVWMCIFSPLRDSREIPHWCTCRWKDLRPLKSHNKWVCYKSDRTFLANARKADRNHGFTFLVAARFVEIGHANSHFMTDEFHFMPDKFHLMPDPTGGDTHSVGSVIKWNWPIPGINNLRGRFGHKMKFLSVITWEFPTDFSHNLKFSYMYSTRR